MWRFRHQRLRQRKFQRLLGRQNHRTKMVLVLALFIAALFSLRLYGPDPVPALAPVRAAQTNPVIVRPTIPDQLVHGMINTCLPAAGLSNSGTGSTVGGIAGTVSDVFFFLTGIQSGDPKSLFRSQVALLGGGADSPVSVPVLPEVEAEDEEEVAVPDQPLLPEADKGDKGQIFPAGAAVVGIYHTHNAESYVPSDGKAKLEGKNGGVFAVGSTLAQALREDYGINAVHAETIHDFPDWNRSYVNSEQTARGLLKANPSLRVILDVHRDSGLTSREASRVKIDGQQVAKILLIVGTDSRFPHPRWKENYQFAQTLAKEMEQDYPGLLKGVRLQPGRYNQHLHPHSLLIEIGSDKNSGSEAERSAVMLARVISEVLKGK